MPSVELSTPNRYPIHTEQRLSDPVAGGVGADRGGGGGGGGVRGAGVAAPVFFRRLVVECRCADGVAVRVVEKRHVSAAEQRRRRRGVGDQQDDDGAHGEEWAHCRGARWNRTNTRYSFSFYNKIK